MKKSAVILLILSSQIVLADNKSQACLECHQHIGMLTNSTEGAAMHHKFANRYLSSQDDKAFQHKDVKYFDKTYHFTKEDGDFKVTIDDSKTGTQTMYKPEMVIGVEPLIQYIVGKEKGAKQVMSMSYDPAKDEWFNVFGDENRQAGEWGHWESRGMNWNSNCAYCHVTDFKKNYNPKDNSFDSTWTEFGISCIQCHQVVSEKCKAPEGLVEKKPEAIHTRVEYMHACASCHSRREELTANKFKTGDSYFDHFRPALPTVRGVYYADGQTLDEDFVFSSFMMCRQYHAGLTCMDCHDWHSMKLLRPADDNTLCLNCHAPEAKGTRGAPTIILEEHTFHKADSTGSLCIECHMPTRFYMQRDERHDHGFTSPDPFLTKYIDIPNACSSCHDKIDTDKPENEKGLDWILENFEKWYPNDERFLRKRARAIAVYRAHEGEVSPELKAELLALAQAEELEAWQATLITLMSPWINENDVVQYVASMLGSDSPLVRSACIGTLSLRQGVDNVLNAFLDDSSTMVRLDAAFALRSQIKPLSKNYQELVEYLDFNSDRPLGALKRADFALSRNDFKSAKEFALLALSFEKTNPFVAREVAIILFRANFIDEAFNLLIQAKQDNPKATEVSYALALFYNETGNIAKAIEEFKNIISIEPTNSRAIYNMSIALYQTGKKAEAIETINKALEIDPTNPQFQQVKQYFEQ
ncbi:MAG: tetratricopeptide repeat protein [Opitutales bacterium]